MVLVKICTLQAQVLKLQCYKYYFELEKLMKLNKKKQTFKKITLICILF